MGVYTPNIDRTCNEQMNIKTDTEIRNSMHTKTTFLCSTFIRLVLTLVQFD